MKKFKQLLVLSTALAMFTEQVRAYCFILPESITYGFSLGAQTAGYAAAIKTAPDVADLSNGRVILANIVSMDNVAIEMSFGGDGVPASTYNVNLAKTQAIGLTADKKGYFIVSIAPIKIGSTLNPLTDAWAAGNWPYYFTDIVKEVRNGIDGGYLRITPLLTQSLPGVVTGVRFKAFTHLGTSYATSQTWNASEAPFSTAMMVDVPVIKDCRELNTCPVVENPGKNKKPLLLEWSVTEE